MVVLWLCFCGGVVVVFLKWWCCGGVFVVVLWLCQWEMPCGTAAEGVSIRIDPCWKNYVQLTSCTWRPFARPLRHQ